MRQLPLNVPVLRQSPAPARVDAQRDAHRATLAAPRELGAEELRHVSGAGTRLPNRTW
ncbi:MAG: hypothetical protein Q7T97_08350 [Burkholderiaceae bacterium]|nr:hypothetical protein [Burkholderiaceae bacterium]